jgi:UMF1 family MFS transporter
MTPAAEAPGAGAAVDVQGRRWLTRRVLAWSLYDVASSIYLQLVPGLFGLYFVTQVAAGPGGNGAWGLIAAASVAPTALVAPVAGAWADRTAGWIRVLAAATALSAAATVLLPQASALGPLMAACAFVCAQLGYTVATGMYDSYVVDVAVPAHRARVSAFGWAAGLAGGAGAALIALWLLRGVPADAQVARLDAVFTLAGVLFGLLALPGLAGLRALRPRGAAISSGRAWVASFQRVAATLRSWRSRQPALRMLTALLLVNDVLVTLQFFIVIVFSTRFGLSVEGMLWLALLFNVVAIPATLVAGVAADRLGARAVMVAMCVVLGGAVLLLAVGRGDWVPAAAITLLGLVYASIQANFRSLYASLVPPQQAAEMFGFNAIAGRLSAALGPLVFGAVLSASGSSAVALLLLLVPLAAGTFLLAREATCAEGERPAA